MGNDNNNIFDFLDDSIKQDANKGKEPNVASITKGKLVTDKDNIESHSFASPIVKNDDKEAKEKQAQVEQAREQAAAKAKAKLDEVKAKKAAEEEKAAIELKKATAEAELKAKAQEIAEAEKKVQSEAEAKALEKAGKDIQLKAELKKIEQEKAASKAASKAEQEAKIKADAAAKKAQAEVNAKAKVDADMKELRDKAKAEAESGFMKNKIKNDNNAKSKKEEDLAKYNSAAKVRDEEKLNAFEAKKLLDEQAKADKEKDAKSREAKLDAEMVAIRERAKAEANLHKSKEVSKIDMNIDDKFVIPVVAKQSSNILESNDSQAKANIDESVLNSKTQAEIEAKVRQEYEMKSKLEAEIRATLEAERKANEELQRRLSEVDGSLSKYDVVPVENIAGADYSEEESSKKGKHKNNESKHDSKSKKGKKKADKLQGFVLSNNEHLIKEYKCLKVSNEKKMGYVIVTNKRLLCNAGNITEIDIDNINGFSSQYAFSFMFGQMLKFLVFALLGFIGIAIGLKLDPALAIIPYNWVNWIVFGVGCVLGFVSLFFLKGWYGKVFMFSVFAKATSVLEIYSAKRGANFANTVKFKPTSTAKKMGLEIGAVVAEVKENNAQLRKSIRTPR